MVAAWVALGTCVIIGIAAGRLITARLAFHGFDGLIAFDALHPPARRRYIAGWHGIVIALLTAVTLIARPSLLIVSIAAYIAGALVAGLMDGVRMPGIRIGKTRPGWTI